MPPTMNSFHDVLRTLELPDAKLQTEIAPGVFAFGAVRPMGRIRAYTSAGLAPFAGRGAQSEFLLLGHVHLDANGRVKLVEGFNGTEGEKWAKQAYEKLKATPENLAPDAKLSATHALRACAHTGIR